MFYILEGLILTILAADMSGIQGCWARQLGLPFGNIAEGIWVTVPIIFLAVSIPPIRKLLGRWHQAVHVIAFGCILFPILIFSTQTSQIPLNRFPNAEASKAIRERFHGQVLITASGGGTKAYVSKAIDLDEVAKTIFALDPLLKTSNTEQVVDGKPPEASQLPH